MRTLAGLLVLVMGGCAASDDCDRMCARFTQCGDVFTVDCATYCREQASMGVTEAEALERAAQCADCVEPMACLPLGECWWPENGAVCAWF